MENTVANLEYIAKDQDVIERPVVVKTIYDLVKDLYEIIAVKRTRWTKQEQNMEPCPCGCSEE